ncbi:MAG: glycosyltransferase [Chloroflexia bacterium]
MVIPTMNRPSALRECIQSVLDGEMQPEQIIVSDQSKSNSTRLMVEGHEWSTGGSSVNVKYLHLQRPNASAARNAGVRATRTELVAFIDDDCIAHRGWLAALVGEYIDSKNMESISSVTGSVLPAFSSRGSVATSSRSSPERRVYRASEGGIDRGEWAPWDTGSGGNLLCPRRTLLDVGGFDTRLGPGTPARAAEDIDLLYRLARAGAIIYQPHAVVYHAAKSRRDHVASRYPYGKGMGSMLVKHLATEDSRTARQLLMLYIRHQGANAFRHGAWGPLESFLVLSGAVGALVSTLLKAKGSRFKVQC